MAYRGQVDFGDLTYTPYQKSYVGQPLEEVRALGQELKKDYYTNLDAKDKLDYTLASLNTLQGDANIKNSVIDNVKTKLQDIVKRGDWENANLAIREASKLVAMNPELNAAMKNFEAAKQDEATARELRIKGLTPLQFGDDPTKFQTINPTTGEIQYYRSGIEAQQDYDKKRESMFDDIQPDIQDVGLTKAEHGHLKYGTKASIAAGKIISYIDNQGGLERYLSTNEGKQELRKVQEIDGVKDITAARKIVRDNLLNAGLERTFTKEGYHYTPDILEAAERKAKSERIQAELGYNNAYSKDLTVDTKTGYGTAPTSAAKGLFPSGTVDLNGAVLEFGKSNPFSTLPLKNQMNLSTANQYNNLLTEYNKLDNEIKQSKTSTQPKTSIGSYGAEEGRKLYLSELNNRKNELYQNINDIIKNEIDKRGLSDTKATRDEINNEFFNTLKSFRESNPTSSKAEDIANFTTKLSQISGAKVIGVFNNKNVREEDGRKYIGVISEINSEQLGQILNDDQLENLKKLNPDAISRVTEATDGKPAVYHIRTWVEHTPDVSAGLIYNNITQEQKSNVVGADIINRELQSETIYNQIPLIKESLYDNLDNKLNNISDDATYENNGKVLNVKETVNQWKSMLDAPINSAIDFNGVTVPVTREFKITAIKELSRINNLYN